MNEELFRIIISLIFCVFSVVLLPGLKRILKAKIGEVKYNQIEKQISAAVLAAEQIFKNEENTGTTKKEFVLDFLHKLKIPLTDKEIDILIEKAVYYL